MPKRTRAAVEAEMQALQAELDTAETDDEIWIKDESGREYKVTGRRATSIFAKLGLNDDDAAGEGEEAEEEEPEQDPAPKGGYFARGKK